MASTALPISNVVNHQKPMQRYNLNDFKRILNEGFVNNITPEVLKTIQSIADQVGAPEYIKTPQFERQIQKPKLQITIPPSFANASLGSASLGSASLGSASLGHDNTNVNASLGKNTLKFKFKESTSNEDWESIRNFQTTVLLKKEGIDASIDQIRKHLNKITTKTYDSLKAKIIIEINSIIKDGNQESPEMLVELNKIGEALFNIASGNSFYSDMYAKLYKELMELYPFMTAIFQTNFDNFRELFNKIEYCDSTVNYDAFCANNKMNEKRRALSAFYVNLMKLKIISGDSILDIINSLQDYILRAIDLPDHKPIADELSEILFILITSGTSKFVDKTNWQAVKLLVKNISSMKPAEHISITNKTIFKHMDMIDHF